MSSSPRFFITVLVCMLIWAGLSCAEDSGNNTGNADAPVTVSARIEEESFAIGDKIKYIIEGKANKEKGQDPF